MLLRERLSAALRDAAAAGDQRATCTLRLILAALKERDHCAREAAGAGRGARAVAEDGLGDGQIEAMLAAMVEQRRSEIRRCEECARLERAEQEAEEIRIIERFLPPKMSQEQIEAAVVAAVEAAGATRLKDTGRVIAALKERYAGQMDFARAKRLLCDRLH